MAFRSRSTRLAVSSSWSSVLSVTSSSSSSGSRPVESRMRATVAAMSDRATCQGDRLTETWIGSRSAIASRHSAAWRQASSIAHSPISPISPLLSATPMKSAGSSRPCSGCCQRSSASTATIRRWSSANTVGSSSLSSSRSRARRNADWSASRSDQPLAHPLVEDHHAALAGAPWSGTWRRRHRGARRRRWLARGLDQDEAGAHRHLDLVPRDVQGQAAASAMRWAIWAASASSARSSQSTTNSSPPNRATVSPGRRRRATGESARPARDRRPRGQGCR